MDRAPLGLTMFVGSMGLMEGKSGGQLSEKFQHMFWRTSPHAPLIRQSDGNSCDGSKLESLAYHPSRQLQCGPIPVPTPIPIDLFDRMEFVLVVT